MGEKEKTNFSLTGIEDDLIKAAVQETIGREHTEEELELLGLEVAENSPEFAILEQHQKQGLWNYPFDGSEVFSPLDENGDEIIPTDIEILRFVAAKFVKREMNFFEITKLEKPITKFDLQPIVFTLIRSTFPKYELPNEKLKSLMDALTSNPTAEPCLSIPVWNGKTMT